MDLSKIPPGMIGQVAGMVADYISSSRNKYLANAVPLTPEQRAAMQPFFPAEILEQSKILALKGERIQDPGFYAMARMMGFKDLPSFSDVAAVTFVDVIVSHEEFTNALLFHELVHVAQYAQLGVKEFGARYVSGFITGGGYEGIPLEKNAYQLEQRYSADKQQTFSVADEVKLWIEAGKF
jgi:hypothetical protein